jgi:hypothetical protein
MNADEAVIALVAALDALAIPYMISGSLATNVYGVPRATATSWSSFRRDAVSRTLPAPCLRPFASTRSRGVRR